MRSRLGVCLAVGLMAELGPAPVLATACNQEIVVPIHFARGAQCWRFTGVATTFTGAFGAGQHVVARAVGEEYFSDGNQTTMQIAPWQIYLSGPGDYSASDDGNGRLDAYLGAGGDYSFQIGPCAVWGNKGTIEICAQ